jgi:Na+-translocating ferredoxin:NAD+ oxidoreductase RnfD subunit
MTPNARLVGTIVYLGLAVLGWGGLAAFLSHPALVAIVAATLSWPAHRCLPAAT